MMHAQWDVNRYGEHGMDAAAASQQKVHHSLSVSEDLSNTALCTLTDHLCVTPSGEIDMIHIILHNYSTVDKSLIPRRHHRLGPVGPSSALSVRVLRAQLLRQALRLLALDLLQHGTLHGHLALQLDHCLLCLLLLLAHVLPGAIGILHA